MILGYIIIGLFALGITIIVVGLFLNVAAMALEMVCGFFQVVHHVLTGKGDF